VGDEQWQFVHTAGDCQDHQRYTDAACWLLLLRRLCRVCHRLTPHRHQVGTTLSHYTYIYRLPYCASVSDNAHVKWMPHIQYVCPELLPAMTDTAPDDQSRTGSWNGRLARDIIRHITRVRVTIMLPCNLAQWDVSYCNLGNVAYWVESCYWPTNLPYTCALILEKTLALYKFFTYLLTYLLTIWCTRLPARLVIAVWLSRPMSVSQQNQLSLPSLRGWLMSYGNGNVTNVIYRGKRQKPWWEVWSTAYMSGSAARLECW